MTTGGEKSLAGTFSKFLHFFWGENVEERKKFQRFFVIWNWVKNNFQEKKFNQMKSFFQGKKICEYGFVLQQLDNKRWPLNEWMVKADVHQQD